MFSRGLTVVAGAVLLAIPTVGCSDSIDQPSAPSPTAKPTTTVRRTTVATTTQATSTVRSSATTTTAVPVVAPEVAQWVRVNSLDVAGLGAALDAIWFSFDYPHMDGLRDALVGCDPPATTLAESSAGILAIDESRALADIADLCTSMAAMESSDDVAALAAARRSLEAAVARVVRVFDAFETMMANGDANESDTTTTVS
jgi:hypothetical protein